jgi:hypothetical protein
MAERKKAAGDGRLLSFRAAAGLADGKGGGTATLTNAAPHDVARRRHRLPETGHPAGSIFKNIDAPFVLSVENDKP